MAQTDDMLGQPLNIQNGYFEANIQIQNVEIETDDCLAVAVLAKKFLQINHQISNTQFNDPLHALLILRSVDVDTGH